MGSAFSRTSTVSAVLPASSSDTAGMASSTPITPIGSPAPEGKDTWAAAEAPAPEAGSSSMDVKGSTAIAPLAAATGLDETEMFIITLQQGNGATFQMKCHSSQSIGDMHSQISHALGARNCPKYAIRLIFKSKVISNTETATLASFGVSEDDTITLVIVRDGAAQRFHGDPDADAAAERSAAAKASRRASTTRGRSGIMHQMTQRRLSASKAMPAPGDEPPLKASS